MGMESQSSPWGPHSEKVIPLGKETALRQWRQHVSREGRSGGQRRRRGL